jgi:hypothetical protein
MVQGDRLRTALSGAGLVASELVEIITKHCPFKPNVAYMPVPRCESCKFWKLYESGQYKVGEAGECTKNTDSGVWSDCDDYTIMTEANFGCVQWEAR